MDRAFILDTIERPANYYALPIERTRDLIDLERNPLIVTKRYQLVARRGTPENPPVVEHVVERPHIHCIVEREGPVALHDCSPEATRSQLSRDREIQEVQELYAACCSPLCRYDRSRRLCGESVVSTNLCRRNAYNPGAGEGKGRLGCLTGKPQRQRGQKQLDYHKFGISNELSFLGPLSTCDHTRGELDD